MGKTLGQWLATGLSALTGGQVQTEKEQDQDWQQEMQDRQNQFNLRMWNLNNEYNNPQNQMKRLQDAGISRAGAAAMLGGGNSAGPISASNMPSAPDQNSSIGIASTLLSGIKEIAMMNSQIRNLDADTRVKTADADRNEKTLTFDIELLKSNNDYIKKQIEKMNKDMQLSDEQIKYQGILNKYADKFEEAKIKQINETIKQTQQAVKNMKQDEAKAVWENMFRTEFGIDPHDGQLNQLVTAALQGDMDKVFVAFEKSADQVFKYLKGIFNDENVNDNPTFLGSPITMKDAAHPFLGTFNHITRWGKSKVIPIIPRFKTGVFSLTNPNGGKSSGKSGYSGRW